jgi:hypothetical protein
MSNCSKNYESRAAFSSFSNKALKVMPELKLQTLKVGTLKLFTQSLWLKGNGQG